MALRSTFGLLLVTLLGLGSVGCDNSPTAPAPPPPPSGVARVELAAAGGALILTSGQEQTLQVTEWDAAGRIVTRPRADYVWSSSAPGTATVDGRGHVSGGPGLGRAVVTVRSPAGPSDDVNLWVQPDAGTASDFRITLEYTDDVPPTWREALDRAARRWEEVVRAELPVATLQAVPNVCAPLPGQPAIAGTETGVRIYVGSRDTFQPGTFAEAVGGPCLQRPLPEPTTVYGQITLNEDKPVDEISPQRLSYLALHEMGHALGLVGVVQGIQPAWIDAASQAYRGPFGLWGYRLHTGMEASELATPGAHWPFNGDVMGRNAGSTRIGPASVGGLMDLGYPAAWYGD